MNKDASNKRELDNNNNSEKFNTKKMRLNELSNEETFLQAVKEGDLEQVRNFINQGININFADEQQKTALHWATQEGHIEIVKTLLQFNADIKAQDIESMTPLHYAAQHGRAHIANALLNHDVSSNAGYVNGEGAEDALPPLHIAASKGDIEVAYVLLMNGASVNQETGECGSALHMATENNHPKLIQFLLAYKANIEALDGNDMTPLHVAANGKENSLMALLYYKANINALDSCSKTPLHHAVENTKQNAVKILLKNGANIEARDEEGQTPLHYAIGEKGLDIVKLLFKMGGNFNALDNNAVSPLQEWLEQEDGASIINNMMEWIAENYIKSPKDFPMNIIFKSNVVALRSFLESKLPAEIKKSAMELLSEKLQAFYFNEKTSNLFPSLNGALGSSVISLYVKELFEKTQNLIDHNNLVNAVVNNEGENADVVPLQAANYIKSLGALSLEKILPQMKAQILIENVIQHNTTTNASEIINTEVNSQEVEVIGEGSV